MIKTFKDFVTDPMNFGLDDLKLNTVHLSKSDNWNDGDDAYEIYLGPVDSEDTLAHFEFTDEFILDLFNEAGVKMYDLYSSESLHTLYFVSDNDADEAYDKLKRLLSKNYRIVD